MDHHPEHYQQIGKFGVEHDNGYFMLSQSFRIHQLVYINSADGVRAFRDILKYIINSKTDKQLNTMYSNRKPLPERQREFTVRHEDFHNNWVYTFGGGDNKGFEKIGVSDGEKDSFEEFLDQEAPECCIKFYINTKYVFTTEFDEKERVIEDYGIFRTRIYDIEWIYDLIKECNKFIEKNSST